MTKFFSDMLLGRLSTEVPKNQGRVVSFAGTDAADIRLVTGSMRERVLGFLYLNGIPTVSREISAGIKSNSSRTSKALKDLIDAGEVEAVKHEGCVMEYALTKAGTRLLKASPFFLSLSDKR